MIVYLFTLFSLIKTIYCLECYDDGREFCINQDDILSVDLLPGSFLLMDREANDNISRSLENDIIDGSLDKAFDEISFHRKRMNEYLCHGYMAEEIFKEVNAPRVKRGPDTSASENVLPDFLGDTDNVTVHDKMLSDEGSSKYKDWLQRTTTLDDVYRHYAPSKKITKKQGFQLDYGAGIEEFDGEVTGYAMQAPAPAISSGKVGPYFGPPGDHISSSSGHNHQYDPPEMHYPATIHEEHYYNVPHEEEKIIVHSKGKGGTDLTLKDFFEIALTALAFLSFGLFVIHLLMNITNGNATTMMMSEETTQAPQELGIRYKRNANKQYTSYLYSGNQELNEISHRVLRSIEAAMVAYADNNNCLQWTLCRDNKFATKMRGAQRLWLPVWSLGMSWLSGKILSKTPWTTIMESTKAAVLGLGGGDCDTLYPNCNLQRASIKRHRRRRRK